jgi:hypothetical protein
LARGCSCCGEDRDPEMVAALLCHDEIKICRICVGWLMRRASGTSMSPPRFQCRI